MVNKCFNIAKALPTSLFSSEEPASIFESLKQAAKSDRAQEAYEKIKNEINSTKADLITQSKRESYLTLVRVAQAADQILRFNDHFQGFRAFFTGSLRPVEGGSLSVDRIKKNYRAKFTNMLVSNLQAENVYSHLLDKSNSVDIANALADENLAKDPKSRKVASIVNRIYKDTLTMINNRGGNVEFLHDYIATQTHDVEKLLQSHPNFSQRLAERSQLMKANKFDYVKVNNLLQAQAFDRWKNTILPLLDKERTFDGENEETSLKAVYNTLLKGKSLDDEEIIRNQGQMMGRKLGSPRRLHFKDGESWVKYNNIYGSGDVKSAILNTIQRNGDRIGLMEMMGPNPDNFYLTLKKRVIDTSAQNDLPGKLAKIDKYFDMVLNRHQIPVNHTLAKTMSALRMMTSMRMLGGVVFNSLPDSVQGLATLKSNGVGFLDRWGLMFKNLLDTASLGTTRARGQINLAESLGVMGDTMMGHLANRFTAIDSPTGTMAKMMGLYFKANGMELWDKNLRSMVASGLARNLARQRNLRFDELNVGLQNNLKRYGIMNKEWDLLRENRQAMRDGNEKMFMGPDMVSALTHDSLEHYTGRPLSAAEASLVRSDIESRLRTYFIDETDMSQLQGSLGSRALFIQGTRAGTVQGELMRSIAQFKQYMAGVTQVMGGRIFLEHQDNSIINNILSGRVGGKMMVETMLASVIFGYLANASSSFVKHGTIPDPTKLDTIKDAAINGGFLGIYGDYLTNNYNAYGKDLLSMGAGPLLSSASDVAKVLSTLTDVNNAGHRLTYHQRALKSIINFSKNNFIPNLFYTKAGIDYLINHSIMNQIDPSYQAHLQSLQRQSVANQIPIL